MKKKFTAWLLIGVLGVACVTGCAKTTEMENEQTSDIPDYTPPEPTGIMATPFVSEAEYLGGDTLTTPELFMYPFDFERYGEDSENPDEPSNDYVSNKELLASADWKDEYYDNYLESITRFADLVYGNDYRKVWESKESFILDYTSFYPEDTMWSEYDESVDYVADADDFDLRLSHSNADEAEQWAEWYSDYKVYGECEIETDKCLVWETGGFHNMRCAFHVTLHTSEEGIAKFNELMGINNSEYAVGDNFTIIYDFQFAKENPEYFIEQSIWAIIPAEV